MTADQRVLVVEDEEGYAVALLRRLGDAGVNAETVSTAFAALDLIERGDPVALLVLDVRLGSGQPNGLALARMIRTKRSIKMAFPTAYNFEDGETEWLGPVLRKADGVEAAVQAIMRLLEDPLLPG